MTTTCDDGGIKAGRGGSGAPVTVGGGGTAVGLTVHVWNWQPVETAPYETPVLTYWPGDMGAKPEYLINTKNSGENLGKRSNWWNSRPDRQPTLWTHIIGPEDAS